MSTATSAPLTHADWQQRAAALTFETRAFIDGAYTESTGCDTFPAYNPATGEVLAHITACTEQDIDRAVMAARRAFESGVWSRQSPRSQISREIRVRCQSGRAPMSSRINASAWASADQCWLPIPA